MRFFNMKALLLWFALISMVVVKQVDAAGGKYIHPGVLDPCKRPGGPYPGCHPNINSPPQQANQYQRGCSKYYRCRSGNRR
ncbi:hypothetical protein REPUB_Repub17cG0054400 [Reevesia pubescens]